MTAKAIQVVVGAYQREDGKYLLQRRSLKAVQLPGLIEWPGGKLEPDDPHVGAALEREWKEELGVQIYGGEVRASLANVKIDDFSMDIFLLNISDIKGEPTILEHQVEILWMDLDEIIASTDLTQSTWVLAHRLLMESQDIIYPGMGER